MPEINQYTLNHKELLELLIKHTGVHEGKWQLLFGLNMATGIMGPTPEQTFPGVMVTIPNVGIQRVASEMPLDKPGVVVIDAAEVNPKK
jgi:hypothetical protein